MRTKLKQLYVPTALALVILLCPLAALPQEHAAQTNANPAFAQELIRSMEVMDKDMMAATMSGDPDHDFCAMMIPHHQGAVDMAKLELLYGKDAALRRLAQEIIVTQEQEIAVMQMRLKQFKTP